MRLTYSISCILLILCASYLAIAQKPVQYNSSEVYHQLERLNTLLSVLYVAAHPDDENQRIISYCNNTLNANTAYLSLTRGDGGQNLIGTERGPLLGVLRTQELIEARRIDGGGQYFTRAIDFGYSKNPKETFGFWDKDKVTSDVVRVFRSHRPDIVINRFDHRTPGRTHGHHTASAMLSLEAFDLSGDPSVYTDQLSTLSTWQPAKIYFNTSWWFYGSREKFAEADKSTLTSVDIGTFYPLEGISNSEIAANARSMHKCQGFGNATNRSSRQEFLELLNTANDDITKEPTQGINTSWSRVPNGKPVGELMEKILENYSFKNPAASLDDLTDLHRLINNTGDPYWKAIKLEELKEIIQSVTGLFLEASTKSKQVTAQDTIEIKIEATNRVDNPIKLLSYSLSDGMTNAKIDSTLARGQESVWYEKTLMKGTPNNHYWINNEMEYGTYSVSADNIGKAESNANLHMNFDVEINGERMTFVRPVTSLNILPDKGEVYAPLSSVPYASVSIENDVFIFSNKESKTIPVNVESFASDLRGTLSLKLDSGWKSEPSTIDIEIAKLGQTKTVEFEVTPPKNQTVSSITPVFKTNGTEITSNVITVAYDHIQTQTVISQEEAKAVNLDIKTTSNTKVGYIMGAGDDVPEALKSIGYEVDLLTLEELANKDLTQYQAIILGIRIYNVNEKIGAYQDELFGYAADGGTLITQYNTSRRLKAESLAPVAMEMSRDRVSDETAKVKILEPDHPVINTPNEITQSDFEGWVQERGLYFPDEFSDPLTPIFSMADPGEDEKLGSLLVMEHGEGYFVYTGISFFRELPAGVPGAYRLMANLISLGAEE